MKRRAWLLLRDVVALHSEQIAQFGGRAGLRDKAMLESALARPRNRAAYASANDFDIAAAYAFGIAKNHPFYDGNKRTALVCAFVFLDLHGWQIEASEEDAVVMFTGLADGSVTEKALAEWLHAHCDQENT